MGLGHTEPADSVTLEVEFDQHHWLPTHNPTVMPRLDRHDLGSLVTGPTSRRTPPISRRSAPFTAATSGSSFFDWRRTGVRVFLVVIRS